MGALAWQGSHSPPKNKIFFFLVFRPAMWGLLRLPPNRDVGRGTRDGQSITPSLRCACTVPAWLSVVLAIDTTYGLVC